MPPCCACRCVSVRRTIALATVTTNATSAPGTAAITAVTKATAPSLASRRHLLPLSMRLMGL
jgi:hypothetical protein